MLAVPWEWGLEIPSVQPSNSSVSPARPPALPPTWQAFPCNNGASRSGDEDDGEVKRMRPRPRLVPASCPCVGGKLVY